ncbi:hypothetical protein Cni_G11186 [Canna indica]|uniref:NAC domain-containing protein n=1 Tax=Canna indica TaxID=4628 RepID=A0AAQ3K5L8_9LILI|nr:hypothetical protein Cni_G11186 [Canna indica]
MEKQGFIREGVLRLPPGFRFHPTDEELVVQYLKRKVFSCPLPASIIPEISLRNYDPWDLPGGSKEVKYFFNLREAKHLNQKTRAARSGYWRAEGKEKKVVASKCNQVVGVKKVLVFCRGKSKPAAPTDWIMHEYHLAYPDSKTGACMVPRGDWVLCRIFKKKRATKTEDETEEDDSRRPCPESSCVTELSDESSDEEEEACSSTRA